MDEEDGTDKDDPSSDSSNGLNTKIGKSQKREIGSTSYLRLTPFDLKTSHDSSQPI